PPDVGPALVPRPGPHERVAAGAHALSAPARRLRFPVLQPHAEPHRAGERRARHRDRGRSDSARGGARARRARAPPRSFPVAALWRRAAARRDRARDREASVGPALRRADRRARQRDGRTGARGAPERQRDDARDDAPDHAQRVGCGYRAPRDHVLGRARARGAFQRRAEAAFGALLVMRLFSLPRWLAPLDRKLLRDLFAMRGQALAIAFVIAGGVSVHLVAAGLLSSLEETRRAYYERYRFADLWAPLVRAPNGLIDEIRRIEGVQAAETRVRVQALFDMPGMEEPATGEVFSLPDGAEPSVNQIVLLRGRLPQSGRRDEAVVLESFANAHGLDIGDTVDATIYGGRERITIVGIALSPEHVYAIAPGQLVPDDRLFGVLWMSRSALA